MLSFFHDFTQDETTECYFSRTFCQISSKDVKDFQCELQVWTCYMAHLKLNGFVIGFIGQFVQFIGCEVIPGIYYCRKEKMSVLHRAFLEQSSQRGMGYCGGWNPLVVKSVFAEHVSIPLAAKEGACVGCEATLCLEMYRCFLKIRLKVHDFVCKTKAFLVLFSHTFFRQ